MIRETLASCLEQLKYFCIVESKINFCNAHVEFAARSFNYFSKIVPNPDPRNTCLSLVPSLLLLLSHLLIIVNTLLQVKVPYLLAKRFRQLEF
jgi:hypothetical protein